MERARAVGIRLGVMAQNCNWRSGEATAPFQCADLLKPPLKPDLFHRLKPAARPQDTMTLLIPPEAYLLDLRDARMAQFRCDRTKGLHRLGGWKPPFVSPSGAGSCDLTSDESGGLSWSRESGDMS